ncbi:MAG: SDR family oxidoreductase, partial [Opitutae bacterium]|nr:SDR family oxidoreductase [Opitutae bacterium]
MSEKIIVIGSNSFSGASFVHSAIDAGFEVVGISRSKEPNPVFLPYKYSGEGIEFHQLDLNHDLDKIMALINSKKPEYVVNFSAQSMVAQSWDHPDHWFMTNVVSTIQFHDQLRHCDFLKKYVHISTPEVYGSCEGYIKESNSYYPSTPYAVSRAAADMSLQTFFNSYKFPVVFPRAANVYGPGQQLYRIIPRMLLFVKLGKKLQLHGGGTSERSFIHMRDVS